MLREILPENLRSKSLLHNAKEIEIQEMTLPFSMGMRLISSSGTSFAYSIFIPVRIQ